MYIVFLSGDHSTEYIFALNHVYTCCFDTCEIVNTCNSLVAFYRGDRGTYKYSCVEVHRMKWEIKGGPPKVLSVTRSRYSNRAVTLIKQSQH